MILNNCIRSARLIASTLFFTITILLFAASVFAQSPTFVRTDYGGLGNNHVAVDFNGDGKLDLAGQGAMSAAIMLGNGDGTFGARVEYPVASWNQDLAAGDFNGDGKLDLVVTINEPQISLSLLIGNGDGTFGAPVNFPNTSGFDSPAIVATDLNNDARPDLVIGHQVACWTAPCTVSRTITVMLGLGDGTFQPAKEIDIGTETAKIAVGDFNRDGFKDLGIASSLARVCILLGVGDGSFNQQPTMTLITENNLGMDATDIDVADLNGDTIEDLVVAVALNGSKTAILTGNGDGTFKEPPLLLTEPGINVPQYQAVADYNGDGFQDLALALANGNSGLMEILNGNGDGTFQPPVYYLKPPDRSSIGGIAIITADFNSDRKPDIALGIGGASHSLAVLRNTTGGAQQTPPPAPTLLSPANDATVAQPVKFDWSDASRATSYTIQIDDSSTFTSPLIVSQTVTVSQFTASSLPTMRLWWRVRGINSAGAAGSWSVTRRFTAQSTSPPSPATLSSLTLNPATIVGGNTSQGTVTLTSAAPSGGAVVALSSNNTTVATVPASVTIAAGSTTATFTITTKSVTASTSVTISAAYGGVTRTATLTLTAQAAPPPPSTDTVAIQIAEYSSGNRLLRVEATSSNASAALNVYVTSTNQLIGTLRNEGGGRYRGDFSWSSNPQNITVRSSLGGSATRTITLK